MAEPCIHEKDWGAMNEVIKGIVKQLYGNGQKGLAFSVPELSTKIDTLTTTIEELRITVSGLAKFEAEVKGVDAYKLHEGLSSRQKAGIIVSGILGVTAIVVTILLKFV